MRLCGWYDKEVNWDTEESNNVEVSPPTVARLNSQSTVTVIHYILVGHHLTYPGGMES